MIEKRQHFRYGAARKSEGGSIDIQLGFVDGYVSFTKIYWDSVADSGPGSYEPPAGYDYSWDGE